MRVVDARTELVIAVDIAKQLGISPQRVNVLARSPGFPKPARQTRPIFRLAFEQRRAVGARYGPASARLEQTNRYRPALTPKSR